MKKILLATAAALFIAGPSFAADDHYRDHRGDHSEHRELHRDYNRDHRDCLLYTSDAADE